MTFLFVIFCAINIYYETKKATLLLINLALHKYRQHGRKRSEVRRCCYGVWSVANLHFQWISEWYARQSYTCKRWRCNPGHDDQCALWWCGVGLLNYFIFIIIAVFISGLMVDEPLNLWDIKWKHGK